MIRVAVVAVLTTASLAWSPASAATGPYPDVGKYISVGSLEKYKVIDREGRWFSTPLGLRCAIMDDGSVGCSGALHGATPGTNEIAWFTGDPFPRLYPADEVRFDYGRVQTLIFAEQKLTYRGTTCAVTMDSAVYCIHDEDPNSQFMVTSAHTYRGPGATTTVG